MMATQAIPTACAAPEVALDFETYYATGYSVQDLGYSAYVADPRFDALLVAVSDGATTFACPPNRFPWEALNGKVLIAHNAAFDQAVFRRLQELGVIPPDVTPAGWRDTAALCAYIGAPRALDEAAAVLLGITLDKSVRARMKGGPDLFDRLDEYGALDAKAAALIWQKFGPYWPEHEQQLSALTIAMGNRGVHLDRTKAHASFHELETQAESARIPLPWHPAQPATSAKALAAECAKHKVPAPVTTSAKEEAFDDWLERYGTTEPARYVRLIQEIRSLNRAAKVLESMLSRVRADGRIDAHTIYFGASTGRWSRRREWTEPPEPEPKRRRQRRPARLPGGRPGQEARHRGPLADRAPLPRPRRRRPRLAGPRARRGQSVRSPRHDRARLAWQEAEDREPAPVRPLQGRTARARVRVWAGQVRDRRPHPGRTRGVPRRIQADRIASSAAATPPSSGSGSGWRRRSVTGTARTTACPCPPSASSATSRWTPRT
jgi:hypothetical protein